MFWRRKNTPARQPEAAPAPPVTDPVHVITAGGQRVAFNDRAHAEQTINDWREAYPNADEFWSATGPVTEDRSQHFRVWSRVPRREFVHHRSAAYREGGAEHRLLAPLAASARWVFEFEEGFTTRASLERVEVRPGRGIYVEAGATGTDEAAVQSAFEDACTEARATARRLSINRDSPDAVRTTRQNTDTSEGH